MIDLGTALLIILFLAGMGGVMMYLLGRPPAAKAETREETERREAAIDILTGRLTSLKKKLGEQAQLERLAEEEPEKVAQTLRQVMKHNPTRRR